MVVAVSGAFFFKVHQTGTTETDTTKRVLSKVGELYILPSGEQPTVAQIKDKTKLPPQSFFSAAEDGDFLLVYTESKTAFIYRESVDKLVSVGPISTEQTNPTAGN